MARLCDCSEATSHAVRPGGWGPLLQQATKLSHNNTGNVEGLMIDVLNYWLETDPEKSWSKLCCRGLWLWSSSREDKTEDLTMS